MRVKPILQFGLVAGASGSSVVRCGCVSVWAPTSMPARTSAARCPSRQLARRGSARRAACASCASRRSRSAGGTRSAASSACSAARRSAACAERQVDRAAAAEVGLQARRARVASSTCASSSHHGARRSSIRPAVR